MAKPEGQVLGCLLAMALLSGCGNGTERAADGGAPVEAASTVAWADLRRADPPPDQAPPAEPPSTIGSGVADLVVSGDVATPPPTEPAPVGTPGAEPTEVTEPGPPRTWPAETLIATVPPAPVPALAPETATPAVEAQDAAGELLFRLNGERAALGLSPLASNAALATSALAQVDAMIARGTLFHQGLADDLAGGWVIVGENVGYGPEAGLIHVALVNSPKHYENLVHTRYTHVGIVAEYDDIGRMWIAQVFAG